MLQPFHMSVGGGRGLDGVEVGDEDEDEDKNIEIRNRHDNDNDGKAAKVDHCHVGASVISTTRQEGTGVPPTTPHLLPSSSPAERHAWRGFLSQPGKRYFDFFQVRDKISRDTN